MHGGGFSPDKYLDETMRKGMVSIVLLMLIKKKSTYPYAMMKAFKKSHHEMLRRMNKSQVYNILGALERDGFVKSRIKRAGLKEQKVYSTTKKGDAVASSFGKIFLRFFEEAKSLIKSEFSG